jgi:hypothetical protein
MPVLKDCTIWYGGYNLTSNATEATLEEQIADVDTTTFASGGVRTRVGGIRDAKATLVTFLDPTISDIAFSSSRGATSLLSIAEFPTATGGVGAAGDRAYIMRGLLQQDKDGLKIGALAMTTASLAQSQSEGLMQGYVMVPLTAGAATITGASVTMGAATAQNLYLGAHVTAVSGDRTMTVKLQSAPLANFASPVDRVTLSAISALDYGFGSATITTTDTFWRVICTIGGTAGNISVAAVAALV